MKRKTANSLRNPSLYFFIIGFAVIGTVILLASHAATSTSSIEPENGTLASNAQIITDGTASGGRAVKFRAPTVVYCGGRSFTAPAHCIGASEWATYTCTTYAQCQAGGFLCYAYMNGDKTKVYDLTNFGNSHSGGVNTIINPSVCGQDFYNVIKGTVPDFNNGNVPQNSKHVSVQNRTQSTINSTLTGSEYDPTKP